MQAVLNFLYFATTLAALCFIIKCVTNVYVAKYNNHIPREEDIVDIPENTYRKYRDD